MARLRDITNVWNTIRELNVSELRDEAERFFSVALIGEAQVRAPLAEVLQGIPGRFPAGHDALEEYDLFLGRDRQEQIRNTDLIVLALDGQRPLPLEAANTVDKLAMLRQPWVVAIQGSERIPRTNEGRQLDLGGAAVVFLPQSDPAAIRERLLPPLVETIPPEQRLAAGRRLAGLRDALAQALIGDTAFSNATYALTSGIPEMIPLLNIPLNAADMLILTKNQALLAYKLGLIYGAPFDFQAQMREILPVIGGGFVWRQLARQLVGLIPGFGLLPKVAVAYAGTYAVGQAAAVWYDKGEALSGSNLKQLYRRAIEIGKQRARELVERRKEEAGQAEPPTTPHTGPTERLDPQAAREDEGLLRRVGRLVGRKGGPPSAPPS